VARILRGEKYLGNNVWNRKYSRLRSRICANPAENWARADGAFAAIVTPEMFRRAQLILAERARRMRSIPTAEVLHELTGLLEEKGRLSEKIIDASGTLPSCVAVSRRFGSLQAAYEQIGYTPDRDLTYVPQWKEMRMRLLGHCWLIVEEAERRCIRLSWSEDCSGLRLARV
jgi:hypothetical protein